ncbi:hypothetical protein Fcan01_12010 [Folsomia candida]|uniref:Transmembrane protein 132E n=1 Tax=Folsomia candida TaxID=158441 RepID=A0A226E6I1_FOLCA|nr:hypothetical protein Fcan01_12010 [Folsomia candida]
MNVYTSTGFTLHLRHVSAVEMHFEPKDGGFFLRSPQAGSTSTSATSSASSSEDFSPTDSEYGGPDPAVLKTEHFTVLPSSQPVSIRVMYGPFSTKQTVPIRLLVPDPLDGGGMGSNGSYGGGEPEMMPPLDLSAHIVTPTVPKDTPILRVLFHAGQTAFGLPITPQNPSRGTRQQSGNAGSRRHRTRLCLVASATKGPGDVVTSSCTPDSRDSTCLAELTLPIHWWPEVNNNNNNFEDNSGYSSPPLKPTKIHVQVSYAVYEPENGHCNEVGMSTTHSSGIPGEGGGTKRIQIQPPTPLATVMLVDAQKSYRVVKAEASDAVKLLVPQGSLYPHAKFYVPVIVGKHEHQSIVAFIMRARVKSGLRIIGIEPNVDKSWNITTDFNPRRTHATITAVRKYDPKMMQHHKSDGSSNGEEVFNWILEAAEEAGDDWDGGRVVWILRYVIQPSADTSWMKKDPFANFSDERHKLTTRLEIQKDDIQAVLPIAKSWEVVNSAVLNGKQVSRPMKIFIVSRAGQVADVTLQASCRSLDESVLKVSSSCTSVYVDGSEIRGSTNATIAIKYGTYEGSAQFTVWMPEFPLDVQLTDSKLNQIKGWRVPNGVRETQGKREVSSYTKTIEMQADQPQPVMEASLPTSSNKNIGTLATDVNSYYGPTVGDGEEDLDDPWDDHHDSELVDENHNGAAGEFTTFNSNHEELLVDRDGDDEEEDSELEDKFHCRPRYQHTRVDVYGRFLAQDQDSGRTSYFISRKTYLKITDLVSDYLRASDTQVAVIKGPSSSSIQGVGPGRTEIQIVSPVTGRVLGTKEIRVLNERVSIASMKVQVISGVQLSLFPDTDSDNQFVAETTMSSKLSAKYQEALLDIKLRFSDNTWVKLDEIEKENYVLTVDSLEPSVVELPPIQNSKYPRIIAVTEGGGPIMRVSLELSDQCHRQNSAALAMSVAPVEVNFTATPSRSEFTQNDSNQGMIGTSKHTFRKNGRKDRKKDSSHRSLLHQQQQSHNSNDIGIPLKDDSSKASMSSQHFGPITVGFIPDKGWTFAAHNTPLEIAMYVLLGVFSVAILVFVASCFVYASRVKKRDISSSEELMGFKMDHHHPHPGFGMAPGSRLPPGGGGCTNAHDWVWLGRASLALHPSLDSNKHPAFSTATGTSSNRGIPSNPIRIITNPNFENMQQPGSSQQATDNMTPSTPQSVSSAPGSSSRLFGRNSGGGGSAAGPPPRPPKPGHSNSNSIDSSTFSMKQQPQSSAGSNKGGGPSSPQGSGGDGSGSAGDSYPDYRPPVPPHRNIPLGTHVDSGSQSPPTRGSTKSSSSHKSSSNSHSSNVGKSSSSKGRGIPNPSDDLPNPCFLEFPEQKRREREQASAAAAALRPPNIVGNPMSYIDEESEIDDDGDIERLTVAAALAARQGHNKHKGARQNLNSSVKLDMDYDQLMEYFDNLKETEA